MNGRKLTKLGVPTDCNTVAIQAVQSAAKYNRTVDKELRIDMKDSVGRMVEFPETMTGDTHFGDLARAIIAEAADPPDFEIVDPSLPYGETGDIDHLRSWRSKSRD